MFLSTLALLAYSTVTLAQAQQWHSDHSSSWSTAESSSASFTALPLPVPTASSSNSSGSADDYTSGLIAALNAHDFTVLATIVGSSSGAITDLLQGGNKTLFAPSDSALSSLASTASSLGFPLDSSDPSTLNTLLSYHIVPRPIEPSDMYEDVPTIVETELTDPRWVQLPDSAPQVLVLLPTSPPSDQFVIQRLLVNTTTVASFTYENLVIRRIDSVLIPPPSLSTILGAPTPEVNLSTFAGAQPSELVSLVNATGITVFAPTNEALAFSLSSGELAGHTRQEVVNTIANHFVQPGTVLYSTNLTSGLNVTSASGQPLGVVTNSTGRFITSNRTTARIVRNNILLSNGVVQIVDSVLFNTAANVSSTASTTSTSSYTESSTTAIIATSSLPSATSLFSSLTETETFSSAVSLATSVFGSATSEVVSALPTRKVKRSRLAPLVV